MDTIEIVSAALFAAGLVHTFAAKSVGQLADRYPKHAGAFHLLGEVETVFGCWAALLIVAMALFGGIERAVDYADSRQYTEPLFVFVVMVVAASRPVLVAVRRLVERAGRALPIRSALAEVWLGLSAVPLLGSLITEPAAMTLAALMLAPSVFRRELPEWLKYGAIGVLFVNVSIGGTLTSYAAPPVLMVASAWQWDTAFMAANFGWKAALAVLINASAITFLLRRHIHEAPVSSTAENEQLAIPLAISAVHLLFLAGIVLSAHHPAIFIGLFLFFIGFVHAYEHHQDPLILKEGLLVGFFLAGLVVLGGMQHWWLQPIVSALEPVALFFGALVLTAITDNAALTYLGSLVDGMSDQAKYMLVAGAVAGGGLTVIANAPNPAGAALLRRGFEKGSVGAGGLLLGALPPTLVAALLFLL